MTTKLISQGAEAKIFLKDNIIIKQRIPKSYRIPKLDNAIRRRRKKAEANILEKASKTINVPLILTEPASGGRAGENSSIKMQFIKGKQLSRNLDKFPLEQQKQIAKEIGKTISKLHKENIAHGDLTTSNMIWSEDKLFLIDFGLSFQNAKYEDKAVDLHVLKQALEAKHWKHWQTLYKEIEKAYLSINKTESKKVIHQLIKVEKRGRYKH